MLPQTKKTILDRIAVAEPDSPIAVFRKIHNGQITFAAVFANTVQTQKIIKSNPPNLVGVFDRTDDPENIKSAMV